MSKFAAMFVVVAAAMTLLACGPGPEPYEELNRAERAFVIPATEDWGRDCAGGPACSSADTDDLQAFDWVSVAAIESTDNAQGNTDIVMTRGPGTSSYDPEAEVVAFTMYGRDHHKYIDKAVDAGYELWVGFSSDERDDGIGYVIAFDDQQRITAIGPGAAHYLGSPLVQAAADPNWIGDQELTDLPGLVYDYFANLAAAPTVQRLLQAPDPGLADPQTFGPDQIMTGEKCVRFGDKGPSLVFPEGTLAEGTKLRDIDVLGGWSGLDKLPIAGQSDPANVEIVGYETTLPDIGIVAHSKCRTEAIYVQEIRILPIE